jgi:hypothetical protein
MTEEEEKRGNLFTKRIQLKKIALFPLNKGKYKG